MATATAAAWPESPTPLPPPHGLRLAAALRVLSGYHWISLTHSLAFSDSVFSFIRWLKLCLVRVCVRFLLDANSFALIWLHVHAYAFAHRCVIYWIFLLKYTLKCAKFATTLFSFYLSLFAGQITDFPMKIQHELDFFKPTIFFNEKPIDAAIGILGYWTFTGNLTLCRANANQPNESVWNVESRTNRTIRCKRQRET